MTTSDGVQLRLKHLIPERSSTYFNILNFSGVPVDIPVVLARGLWSNLTAWEFLGGELANEGKDIWLIEITGGPNVECDTCQDYSFDDLTNFYVPALLNGVLNFTNKNRLQYVGFSNGCRATLSSLEKNKFDPSKVETFVAVGCPGAFEGESLISKYLKLHSSSLKNDLSDKKHISLSELGISLKKFCGDDNICIYLAAGLSKSSNTKISFNLSLFYLDIINSTNDQQPGKNVELSNFNIIHGYLPTLYRFFGFLAASPETKHDLMVTTEDANAIYNNIISTNKRHFRVMGSHGAPESLNDILSLPDRTPTKRLIKKMVNKQQLSSIEKTINLINSTMN